MARRIAHHATSSEKVLSGQSPATWSPTSVRMILVNVSEHPDSSIGEIASRTGFPQSHVSASAPPGAPHRARKPETASKLAGPPGEVAEWLKALAC